MCTYCMMADHTFKFYPPWPYTPVPFVPVPVPTAPATPWPLEQLREYYDLLKRIKAMEDQLGLHCQQAKADYLKMFEERISKLEQDNK